MTNGVACFQRIISSIIEDAGLQGTITYMDVTICGKNREERDQNSQRCQRGSYSMPNHMQ